MRNHGKLLAALLLALAGIVQVGCRACGGCEHDYASPVAGCEPCGHGGRSGSVISGSPVGGLGMSGVYTGGEHALDATSRVASEPIETKTR